MVLKRLKIKMKIVFTSVSLFFLTGCMGQIEENKKGFIEKDSIQQTREKFKLFKKDAFQMNMGFNNNPVWVWAKYDNNLNLEGVNYNHIYGIKYWDEESNVITLYYETDREKKNKDTINFSNYILKPYPGDKTLQLIGKYGDTLLLFNVLENKNFGRTFKGKDYQRIPTINVNSRNEKVSDYDIEINFSKKDDSFYEITIIDNEGIDDFIFKSNCLLNKNPKVSYYDLTNDRIYLLENNCYLEKVDL